MDCTCKLPMANVADTASDTGSESPTPPRRRITWRDKDQRRALRDTCKAARERIEVELESLSCDDLRLREERTLAQLVLGESCLDTIEPLLTFKDLQQGNYIFRRQENQIPVATKFVASLTQILKSICINQRRFISQDTLAAISEFIQVVQSTRID